MAADASSVLRCSSTAVLQRNVSWISPWDREIACALLERIYTASAAPTPGAAPPSSMGNFLDTPITEKETEVGEDESKGVCYGCARGDSRCAAPWRWPLPTPSHPDPSRGALGAGSPRCKGGARTWRTITSTCSPSLPSYHIYHSLGSLTGMGCAHSLVSVMVRVRLSSSP